MLGSCARKEEFSGVALVMEMLVCRSAPLVQTEVSQQQSDGLMQDTAETFMVARIELY